MYRYCVGIVAILVATLIGYSYVVTVNTTVTGIFDVDSSMLVVYSLNYSKEHAQLDVFWVSNTSEILKKQSFVLPKEMGGDELEPSGVEPIPLYFYGVPGILFVAEEEDEEYGESYVTLPMINASSDLYDYLSRFWVGGMDYFVSESLNEIPVVGNESTFCTVTQDLSLGECYSHSFNIPWPLYIGSAGIIVSEIGSGEVYLFSEGGWKKIYSPSIGGFIAADIVDDEIHYLVVPPKDMRNRANCSYAIFSLNGEVKFSKEFSCSFLSGSLFYSLHIQDNVSYLVEDNRYLYASLDKTHWIPIKKFEATAIPVKDYLVLLEVVDSRSRISVEQYPSVGLVSDLGVRILRKLPTSFSAKAKNVTLAIWAQVFNNGLLDCDMVNVSVYVDEQLITYKIFSLDAFDTSNVSFVIPDSDRFGVGDHTVSLVVRGSEDCNETYLENNKDSFIFTILPACKEGELNGTSICRNGIFVPCTCSIPECAEVLNCSKPVEYVKPTVKTRKQNILPYILGAILVTLILIFVMSKLYSGGGFRNEV